jgi:hypothetical protein
MELPLDEATYEQQYGCWKDGMPLREAFPTLNDDQREFLRSGMTPDDWKGAWNQDPWHAMLAMFLKVDTCPESIASKTGL